MTGHDEPHGSNRGSARVFSRPYARRLFGLLTVVIIAGLSVRWALIPKGFGTDGHHRPEAPAEEAARAPLHVGAQVCGDCHEDKLEAHDRDVHVKVPCEDCHGAGGKHVEARGEDRPASEGPMFRDLEQANCLACHRRLIARPKLFPTIDVETHFAKVGVAVKDTTCQSCHDPHQPLFLQRPVSEARIHPLIHRCGDCHHEPDIESKELPESHVVTFRCKDCHEDVVADFTNKPHAKLGCPTCHIFHKDSDFSGRIHKNGSPQFCLLCHQDKPFKARKGIPLIESLAAHREEMGDGEEDAQKVCTDCHMEDAIHGLRVRPKIEASPEKEAP